ncbi:MAG TPA: universal stress protein [Cyclobacteriaceae bacterium]
MKKILVPCDFSIPAINAFRFALDTAVRSGGTVHLLNVIELPVLHDTVIMPVLYFEENYFKEMRETTLDRFKKLVAKFNKEGVKVIPQVEFGPATTMIIDYAVKKDIDLIVMGTHGATGVKEYLIGSNAEKIVRSSPVPVLTIKDFFKGPIKSIVFPNALENEDQEELVLKVKALQDFFKAHLYIVWINTPANFSYDILTYPKLEAFAKEHMLKNYSLDVFNHNSEEEGILLYTQMVGGNMIALGTHGRRGISHLMHGSVAEEIVNHSKALIWTSVIRKKKVKAK